MELQEFNGPAVRKQLEQVLSSAGFAHNDRLSGFLRFVVERHLEGRDTELKESLIAIEVFGRKPDYDPKQDAIVRTEAVRLRARLSKYYQGEGSSDRVIIELPKGGYTPVFRQPASESVSAISSRVRGAFRLGPRLWFMAALTGLAVALAATGWWRVQRQNAPVAIAVLPLQNLSHDPASDYFADGLTDELIRNLSIIDGLATRSRTSSFAFRGKPLNVREAGKQLAADYILEGSVLRAGGQLRINVQLIRTRDDSPLWAGKYDRELTDVFAIQDEISRGIVNSLRLKLGRGPRHYETNAEAYDLYLRARAMRTQEGVLGNRRMIGLFEEALAKDPSLAPAYAGLAAAYAYRSGLFGSDRADELAKMRAAAEKAIELDPLLPEAHDALGIAYARNAQWQQAEKSFRRAIELDPNSSTSHVDFALYLLLVLNRVEEAVQQLRVGEKADPLSPEVQDYLAFMLTAAGRFDEAAAHCQRLPAGYRYKNACLARARLGQGRTGEAIQLLAGAPNGGYLGYAYARAGRREEAEKLAAADPSKPFNQALIFAGLGDKDRTLEALDRMTPLGPARIGRALTYPEFALLRGDPRVKALRKKVGLPE
ncbi:MAG: tetratricopeptide repeat protein [Acidobacteria bacterium]|nr:tetratricopeptide repeat protein [Acidobacteriota bacterium]